MVICDGCSVTISIEMVLIHGHKNNFWCGLLQASFALQYCAKDLSHPSYIYSMYCFWGWRCFCKYLKWSFWKSSKDLTHDLKEIQQVWGYVSTSGVCKIERIEKTEKCCQISTLRYYLENDRHMHSCRSIPDQNNTVQSALLSASEQH